MLLVAAGVGLGCGFQNSKRVVDSAAILGEIADLLGKARDLTYTADYDVAGGRSVAVAQRPPSAAFVSNGGRFIATKDRVTRCDSAGSCQRAPRPAGSTADYAAAVTGPGFVTPDVALGIVATAAFVRGAKVDSSTKTIAGRDVICANVHGLEAASTPGQDAPKDFSLCVTREGALASFDGTLRGGLTGRIQLRTFTPSTDATAFDVPPGAKVVDVPTLPLGK